MKRAPRMMGEPGITRKKKIKIVLISLKASLRIRKLKIDAVLDRFFRCRNVKPAS
jgi:hypothetical protein